jgi:hypothetical protein
VLGTIEAASGLSFHDLHDIVHSKPTLLAGFFNFGISYLLDIRIAVWRLDDFRFAGNLSIQSPWISYDNDVCHC